MDRIEDRLAAVERVLNDPPPVHLRAPGQVWNTSADCYRFLAEHCPPDSRTLETGLGVSTVLFAVWGARHTCVIGLQVEVDRCREYLAAHGIEDHVRFEVGLSHNVLPTLEMGEIDTFLIDGGHAFPDPEIDWFYGARWLRKGGTLVVDDLQLPAVGQLKWFLDRDPRWSNLAGTRKWAGYRRDSEGSLRESHAKQRFLNDPSSDSPVNLARKLAGRIYRTMRPRGAGS